MYCKKENIQKYMNNLEVQVRLRPTTCSNLVVKNCQLWDKNTFENCFFFYKIYASCLLNWMIFVTLFIEASYFDQWMPMQFITSSLTVEWCSGGHYTPNLYEGNILSLMFWHTKFLFWLLNLSVLYLWTPSYRTNTIQFFQEIPGN